MVDIGDKKKDSSSSSKSSGKKPNKGKKRDSKSKSGGSSSSSSSEDTEPFEMSQDMTPDLDNMDVPDTSQEWAADHSELNFDVKGGESEREYIQRQIEECEEFYENYYARAKDNMVDINQFALYHHALNISLARNRIGIRDMLMDRFGYSEEEAFKQAKRIAQKAGEMETMEKLLDNLTRTIIES